MIRYPISRQALENAITAQDARWLKKAAARTAKFRKQRKYSEKSSIWSDVKGVYMELQGKSKCAYCERKLESIEYGRAEQDVEHFRPKGNVSAWEVPEDLRRVRFTAVPRRRGHGYYQLAYHLFNYAAACKPCNTALKSDSFPIAGTYKLRGVDPAPLFQSEKPYLLYPIGDIDTDPEELIEFYGISPRPLKKRGHGRNRALVTIAFFALDDVDGRKNLVRERAMILDILYPHLHVAAHDRSSRRRQESRQVIADYMSATASHANCARSFVKLFERDPAAAKSLHQEARAFITSIS